MPTDATATGATFLLVSDIRWKFGQDYRNPDVRVGAGGVDHATQFGGRTSLDLAGEGAVGSVTAVIPAQVDAPHPDPFHTTRV